MDFPIARRTFLRAGLAVPAAALVTGGAAGCAGAGVVAGPIARYAGQMVVDVFAEKALELAMSRDFSPALQAAKEKLEQAVGPLTDLFGAEVTAQDGDVVLTGIHTGNQLLGSSLQPFDWQPVTLPLPVQIGLAYHADFIMKERRESDWHGWGSLSRSAQLAALRKELLVRQVEPTDQTDLTRDTTYLCTIAGGGSAVHNDNIQITWKPTIDRVKQTMLAVRRGNVPDNVDDAVWEADYDTDPLWMHYDELWKDAPET